ncbi:hypothetical protein HUN39_17825 [Methylocystis sp. FS]|jgi:hypothetical protein|nr:hypothetical protein [Methylocystis silviterrae]NUJ81847.1 hypothetical protein [Methylocystis silviterrae]
MADGMEAHDATGFEKLIGRTATETERRQLRRVKEVLGLRDNDALWLVIFALQYYDSLYRQFPKAIATEAAAIMTRTRETADAQMRAGVEQAKADLARAVALAAQDVARDVARRQATQWLAYGMAVGAALVVTGIAIGRALAP